MCGFARTAYHRYKEMLSELVLPVFPVFKSVAVITGKGLRRRGGHQFEELSVRNGYR